MENIDLVCPSGLGTHFLADFYGCRNLPNKADALEHLMNAAADAIRATRVTSSFHEFSPHGLSGVVVIAESHLAVHTWPEHKVACIDLFTCSADMDARPGLKFLFESLGASSLELACRGRANQDKFKPNQMEA